MVSTNINWSGSPLKAMRSKALMIVWRIVRPATTDDTFSVTVYLKSKQLTIANAVDILVGEDTGFVIVGPMTCLLKESRRKTVGIGFVVNKLRVNKIVDLNSVML